MGLFQKLKAQSRIIKAAQDTGIRDINVDIAALDELRTLVGAA